MRLRGTDFGPVLGASGVEGFFSEGYPYHKYLKIFPGFSFEGVTFVAKTATADAREGNMPLDTKDCITPLEFKPKCIYVDFWRGHALNAVGLSNPGVAFLLSTKRWTHLTKPFLLSFMAVGKTPSERLAELDKFVSVVLLHKDSFRVPFGLQINLSCPNTSVDPQHLINEGVEMLNIARRLGVSLMPKVSVSMDPHAVAAISDHEYCHSICFSNTVKFGDLPHEIDWVKLFGTKDPAKSPLAQYGGGGLSGRPILPLTLKYIDRLRSLGVSKPFNIGGGILSADDVRKVREVDKHPQNSIFVGSVVMLRPWRLQSIVREGHELFGSK